MEDLKRILHVDDDEDIRVIVKMALELIGQFEVAQFCSGAEALKHAADFNPQMFLLDVMMPEMTGEETWKALRQIPGLEKTPAIFLTAKAEASFAQRLLDQGCLAVITKPFDPVDLCARLSQHWADLQAG
ncbi:Response regulator receiver domain-containing protein [Thalassovita litoralis]|jgi:CheY-like chemotaxis protein|uniref:Response regulator receiver domain-containing protein n=1 Tax=Thalassovita litoralis TaxID=1010611 RepID=A0A521FPU2_9RHOB|nr:response regulator [Thalassovita litoralis]SMO98247.1 Response regulator receiver domain-containing protein [Thalassovita litoralis]